MSVENSILPWIGGFFCAVAAFPQVYRSIKINTTNDLHVSTMILRISSAIIMTIYGFLEVEY